MQPHGLTGHSRLPLIRLSLTVPFVEALRARGIDVTQALGLQSLSIDDVYSTDTFLPAQVIYSLLEDLAEAADDPYLAVTVGESLELGSWPVFAEASAVAASLGDFFNRFVIAAGQHATSVSWELKTDGSHALFRSRRVFEPTMVPAQADAFYAGLFVNIFRRASGIEWVPRQVAVTVCDLSTVPRQYQGLMLLQGDSGGPSIRFPIHWLILPFENEQHPKTEQAPWAHPPRALISSIRESLLPYADRPDLTVAQAASICGHSERNLRRWLQAAGTSLSREIAQLRREKACQLLSTSTGSIADVAGLLGFSSPSVFSRWFKKQTGTGPREYRKQHRAV
jgi:AraC-like DNA-binding protein